MLESMEKIVNLCKGRGYIYPGSEIYGGLANSWDYGPLGVELLNNIKKAWMKKFVQESKYNVGLDAAILMNPQTWVATGHVGGFSDPLIDCKECKTRHRTDKLIEEWMHENNCEQIVDGWTDEEMINYIKEHNIVCPSCGKQNFTDIRKFNLMFKTFQGVTEDSTSEVYLRPETAQGIFVNFKNVLRTSRKKMPMGIAQIGKAFRNEITPGNFIFRTREFEQMELEFFCKPGTDLEWFDYWRNFCQNWLLDLGIKKENIRLRDHSKEELVFYSKATTDIEFAFPFGWGELWGIADRTDYDLTRHMEHSKQDLTYLDQETGEKYVPYVIEPSLGAGRVLLAFLCNSYDEEEISEGDVRTVLHLHPALAPYKVAVLPLSKKLSEKATEVYEMLSKKFMCDYDEAGSIGKRYRREDEIGTPYCVTIDFDTLEDNTVTVRDRDTMEQIRISIDELTNWIEKKTEF
ncbi:MAG: glycine--tRNA ligase [Clostridiales bacterium]|nr:glycine--tRNA ligase [Clostridiales bacterium]